ncbi:MAG: ribose 5-phosphate isomerase B [Anaerolineaceae bacterium]|nr:MAG: ribose 5-phosphate isomerase B [Anaerolineaceae bacterium]
MKTIVIGCDNAAVGLKNILIQHMKDNGITVEDMGCDTAEDTTYYPLIAKKVCDRIIESDYTKEGVLICGTGIGMAMTANKFKGIRAAVCHDIYSAERAKLSNKGNVICMGERVIGSELAKKMLDEWLGLSFVDGSSTPKVQAIIDIENINLK